LSRIDAASSEALRENYCEEEDHNGFAEDKVRK
jgi:hypothetical protein